MKTLFEELVKKGYQVHNKRVLGDPKHTSEETKSKDAIQELALVIEWIRVNFKMLCGHTMPTKIDDKLVYGGKIWQQDKDSIVIGSYDTPQEATEAALLHTLQNLII